MNKSESIKELATALAKAQGEMSNPKFDSENPHFRSKYASLASVRNAVIPVMAKHGLSVIQHLTSSDTSIRCGVIITHASGEWMEFEPFDIPASKHDAHGFMSAGTYAKRGTLQAVACVVGDLDDDGNAAVITPSAGVEAKLTAKERAQIQKVGAYVKEALKSGNDYGAYEELEHQNFSSPEAKIALWAMFDSKERARLKTMADAAQTAGQAAGQA